MSRPKRLRSEGDEQSDDGLPRSSSSFTSGLSHQSCHDGGEPGAGASAADAAYVEDEIRFREKDYRRAVHEHCLLVHGQDPMVLRRRGNLLYAECLYPSNKVAFRVWFRRAFLDIADRGPYLLTYEATDETKGCAREGIECFGASLGDIITGIWEPERPDREVPSVANMYAVAR
jgi:hypothetical protein